MSSTSYGAIVVGGGFAGVVAARDLAATGESVLLLEARPRLGGRTWTRKFADTDYEIELGGAWVAPAHQQHVREEVERYGIELEPSPPAQSYPTVVAGESRGGPLPVPAGEVFDLERACFHIMKAASRIDPSIPLDLQPVSDLDVSWQEFLSPLNLPRATHEYVNAIACRATARYPGDAAALFLLHQIASFDNSIVALWGARHLRFVNGTKSLLDAIADDAEVEVRLGTPVASVQQDSSHVSVTTSEGEGLTAGVAIIAIPMNCWNDIAFTPELGDLKRTAAAERNGTPNSGKYWALVRGGERYAYRVASPESNHGALSTFTELDVPEGQLMVGMCCDPAQLNLTTRAGVTQAVSILAPGADVVKYDHHDWNQDPYSKGGWASYIPGRLSRSHSQLGMPEGRLMFATADIAIVFTVWIDGALEAGRRAAAQAVRRLSR